MKKKRGENKIFRKAVDVWSFFHLLGGGVFAVVFFYLSVNLLIALGISFGVFVLWEFGEVILWKECYHRKLGESFGNHTVDIVVAVIGFLFVWNLLIFI